MNEKKREWDGLGWNRMEEKEGGVMLGQEFNDEEI